MSENNPIVLVVERSSAVRSMLARQLEHYAPHVVVRATGCVVTANELAFAHREALVVAAIGSMALGDELPRMPVLRLIQDLKKLRSVTRSLPIIGATSILESATMMLAAGCDPPIVDNKADWHRRILVALGIPGHEPARS